MFLLYGCKHTILALLVSVCAAAEKHKGTAGSGQDTHWLWKGVHHGRGKTILCPNAYYQTRGYISTAETAPLYCVMCRHCVYVYHKTGTIQCMFYCVVLLLVSRPHRSLVTINTAKIPSICCCHYYVCVKHTLRMRTVLGLCWSPRAHNFDSSGVRKHNPRFAQLECDPRISAHS